MDLHRGLSDDVNQYKAREQFRPHNAGRRVPAAVVCEMDHGERTYGVVKYDEVLVRLTEKTFLGSLSEGYKYSDVDGNWERC